MAGTISSPVDLCNLACSQVGARAVITSINPSDGSKAGDACSLLYQPTIDAFARAAHWNCNRFVSQLSLLKAAAGTPENPNGTTLPVPPLPYLYEYQLPPDCLKARFVVPAITPQPLNPPLTGGSTFLPTGFPRGGGAPFVVSADLDPQGNEIEVLMCNLGTANSGPPQLVYTRRVVNVGLFDSLFVRGAASALATWLVNPLSASASMMSQAVGIAKAVLDSARIADGNEGTQDTSRDADWITFRYAGRARPAGLFIAPYDSFGFGDGSYY